ncbi:MAG: hypothetical protein ABSH01_17705 [Terriglobia bacterium]|jgi:hypothetical protein
MISPKEGLKILRNWRKQNALLWLGIVEFKDAIHGPHVRVEDVLPNPRGLLLRDDDSQSIRSFDLSKAKFDWWEADALPFTLGKGVRSMGALQILFAEEKREFVLVEVTFDA